MHGRKSIGIHRICSALESTYGVVQSFLCGCRVDRVCFLKGFSMENAVHSIDTVSRQVAVANDLRLLPALMQNAMLQVLCLRCQGTGIIHPFRNIFRGVAWLGNRQDTVTVFLFREGDLEQHEVRIHPDPAFGHRLEYEVTKHGAPFWTPFVSPCCLELLIPTHVLENYGHPERE